MSIRFVKDFIVRLYRFIMPSAGPVDHFEYPNLSDDAGRSFHETVGRWKYNAAINYQSMDDITKSLVTELRWYKNVEGMEHEYIVVTCRRTGEDDVYLRLERRPADIDQSLVVPEQALTSELRETLTEEQLDDFKVDVEAERKIIERTVWTTIQKSVSKSKNNLKSTDSVMRVGNREGFLDEQFQLISRYENFKRPFYVRDLAFLACAVNDHDPNHQFFVHQCYWYARTLVNAAVAIYQPTVIDKDHIQAAGTYTVTKRLPSARIIQVDVNKDCHGEVDLIKATFRDSLAFHDAQVQKRFRERVGIIRELEDQVAAAEQRIRELESQVPPKNSNTAGNQSL